VLSFQADFHTATHSKRLVVHLRALNTTSIGYHQRERQSTQGLKSWRRKNFCFTFDSECDKRSFPLAENREVRGGGRGERERQISKDGNL